MKMREVQGRKRERPKRRWMYIVRGDIKENRQLMEDVSVRATPRRISSNVDPK